jgi:hypothetical protein
MIQARLLVPDSQPNKPIVRRAVFALDPDRRRQILEVLWYIEHRHHFIDPDMFDIDLDDVEILKRLFRDGDDEGPLTISVTHDEVFALDTCVTAADVYAHRKGERALCNVSDEDFVDLGKWMAETERWFITPLKDQGSG